MSSSDSYAYVESVEMESIYNDLQSVGTYEEPVTELHSNNVAQSLDSQSQVDQVYETLRWEYIEWRATTEKSGFVDSSQFLF